MPSVLVIIEDVVNGDPRPRDLGPSAPVDDLRFEHDSSPRFTGSIHGRVFYARPEPEEHRFKRPSSRLSSPAPRPDRSRRDDRAVAERECNSRDHDVNLLHGAADALDLGGQAAVLERRFVIERPDPPGR